MEAVVAANDCCDRGPNGGSVAGDALAVWIGCECPDAGRNACWDMKAGQRRPRLAKPDEC